MLRRTFRGGMMILFLVAALSLIGAAPASAADGSLWIQGWQWLVNVWAKTGLEIDPNGTHVQVPPGGVTPTTPTTTTTTGSARIIGTGISGTGVRRGPQGGGLKGKAAS